MGKKYLDTKEDSLESSILAVWQEAAKKQEKLDPVGKEDDDVDNDGDVDSSDKYLAKRRKAISKAIKKDEGVKEHKGDKPHKHPHEEKEVEEGKVVFDDHDADDKDFIKLIKKHGLKAKSDGEDTTVTGSPDKIEKVLQTMYGNDWKDMYTRKGQNFENFAGKEVKEYYEIGTDEYRDHTLEVTPG